MDLSKFPLGTKFRITGCKNPNYIGWTIVYTDKSPHAKGYPHLQYLTPDGKDDGWDHPDAVEDAQSRKAVHNWWVEIEPLKVKLKKKVM